MAPIYAIGDIHGNASILRQAYARIDEDARSLGIVRPQVVLLGDYVDRGSETRETIDLILANRARYDQIELMGNHDHWLSCFIENGCQDHELDEATLWVHNSPSVTLKSYGLSFIKPQILADSESVRRALVSVIPQSHREFLQSRPLSHRVGGTVFVHAGIDPERDWEGQQNDPWVLLWNRPLSGGDSSLMGPDWDPQETHGFSLIHGHFRRLLPEARPGRLNLDTSAFFSHHLAVARVDPENGRYQILPVAGTTFYNILYQLLQHRLEGGAEARQYTEIWDQSAGESQLRFCRYVEGMLNLGRQSIDQDTRRAANETYLAYERYRT